MSVVAVIPARMASTRLPGKPLLKQTGKYLVQHVYEQVGKAPSVDRVIVATDDQRIVEAVKAFGGEALLTRADHPSGTDRVAEVAASLEPGCEIILNVQGDEPEIEPYSLDRLIDLMRANPDCPTGTLACPLPDREQAGDPNCVKVVLDRRGRALYFSRGLIPYPRERKSGADEAATWLLHLGVYAYRRPFLLQFASWPPTPLEKIERLEQLRALEHGASIVVGIVDRSAPGIDTPEDYAAFVERSRRGAESLGSR